MPRWKERRTLNIHVNTLKHIRSLTLTRGRSSQTYMDVILNLKCISLISCAELIQPHIFPGFRCRPVGSKHDDCLARQALTYLRNVLFLVLWYYSVLSFRIFYFRAGATRGNEIYVMSIFASSIKRLPVIVLLDIVASLPWRTYAVTGNVSIVS